MPVPREERVVLPVTERVPVTEVVARVDTPLTVKAVADAVVKLAWPLAQRIPETEREVEEATPRIGVTRVGEVCRTFKPVPVLAVTYRLPPEVDWTVPAPRLAMVVVPLALTEKTVVKVEEATLKISALPAVP